MGDAEADAGADVDDDGVHRAEAEATTPTSAPAAPTRRWLPLALGAVLVLVVAGLIVEWRHASNLDHRVNGYAASDTTRREVEEVASQFGEALLTYDYNDLSSARSRVLALSTAAFGQQYTTEFTGGLDVAITKLQATSKATVDSVYVGDILSDTAKAIVTLDSEVHSSAGTRRTIGSYLDLTLKRENGSWKVDTVTSVAALDQQTIAPDGSVVDSSSTTPTTVAPAPPDTSASSPPGG